MLDFGASCLVCAFGWCLDVGLFVDSVISSCVGLVVLVVIVLVVIFLVFIFLVFIFLIVIIEHSASTIFLRKDVPIVVKGKHLLLAGEDELNLVHGEELKVKVEIHHFIFHLILQECLITSRVFAINVCADDKADGTTEVLQKNTVLRAVRAKFVVTVVLTVLGQADELVAVSASSEVDVNGKLVVKDGSKTFHIGDGIFKTETGTDVNQGSVLKHLGRSK